MPALLIAFVTCPAAMATPLLAGFTKVNARAPQSVVTSTFAMFVAPIPNGGGREPKGSQILPEPVLVDVPTGSRTYEAKDWYILTKRGDECFVPDFALLNVVSVSRSRVIGIVHWHGVEDDAGRLRCAERAPVQANGRCRDGSAPKVPVCSNGSSILMEFNGILDEASGDEVEPAYFIDQIRGALIKSR